MSPVMVMCGWTGGCSHCLGMNKIVLCFIPGGAVHTDTRASGHSLQWTKALISKPAPHWEGTAVINGEMKELKLTDYKVTEIKYSM